VSARGIFARTELIPENEDAIRWMRISFRIMLYSALALMVAAIYFHLRKDAALAPTQPPLREIVDVLIAAIVVVVGTMVFGNSAVLGLIWQQFAAGRNERLGRALAWLMFAGNLAVPLLLGRALLRIGAQPLWLALLGPALGQAIIFMFLFARLARARGIIFRQPL
jgi:type IV secretory pathway VirB2 component (pilin)